MTLTERKLPISLVVITKNEASCLAKCLESANFVSEIVVVDSGSTDETVKIAERFGAKVFHQDWLGFGPQKQFAVNCASYDWVLCLDADEYLSPKLKASLQDLFKGEPTDCAYQFPRCNKFLGRFLRHGEGYPDWCLRLFNRQYAQWSDDLVHEKIITKTDDFKVGVLGGDLMHESGESLYKYIEKQNTYTSLQANRMFSQGVRVTSLKIILSPFVRFLKYYFLKFGFLDGMSGFVHISIGCFTVFLKYAKLKCLLLDSHRKGDF